MTSSTASSSHRSGRRTGVVSDDRTARDVIAGEPAVIVDYTVKVPDRARTYVAREAYVVHNSHLFICTFIGLQETLAVFDAILASIEFPE